MLLISQTLIQTIRDSAKEQHPIEACGIIVKKNNDSESSRLIPMKNVANSETFFQFDSKEQLRVWREVEDNDEHLWVLYHSHTQSEAYPSRTDVAFAMEPHIHYVIVSTQDVEEESVRSFRINEGRVVEENIRILCD